MKTSSTWPARRVSCAAVLCAAKPAGLLMLHRASRFSAFAHVFLLACLCCAAARCALRWRRVLGGGGPGGSPATPAAPCTRLGVACKHTLCTVQHSRHAVRGRVSPSSSVVHPSVSLCL